MMDRTFDFSGIRVPKLRKPQATIRPAESLAVCPFTIVADSREQLPYAFTGMLSKQNKPLAVRTVTKGLRSGDYSIDGLEDRIAVERKSLDDLYGSVTWGRKRFEAEIERMDSLGISDAAAFFAVVIEATWPEIVNPAAYRPGWENRTDPRSVEGTIVAWSMRYKNVHWWPCGDRRGAECRTFAMLRRFWENERQDAHGTESRRQ